MAVVEGLAVWGWCFEVRLMGSWAGIWRFGLSSVGGVLRGCSGGRGLGVVAVWLRFD